ncbi:oligopeptide ABC transporter substrate-binding protein [Virgibacillus salexigens]|uniref:Oligopeptide-binding protein AppA n=2 Tax=Virgibacillus TaxID=84406 RepID=A0A024Q8L5_9BACI|nr:MULTISPECIES: oligopeptide ABC transporter substrate-binding protein [Virgibacillus]GGJ59746.1 ABC transporter substrate-binding protein [Virgibacillus kapii]CDQ38873.1 Oligopeptide-binding protein AppA precursor [Virgibacillus massiliensis]
MRKTSWSKALLALLLVLLLALAACSGGSEEGEAEGDSGGSDSNKSEDSGKKLYSIDDFSAEKTNEGEAIDGGHLKFGLVTDTAFEGTLNWNFYSGAYDSEVIKWFDEPLLADDENYMYTQDGAATFETSEDGRVFTFTIRDNVNWHDGEPVTAEDWAFSYEVIGHPDYNGVRYGEDFTNVEGMEAYHNGEADSISGIEVVDEKTLKITYKEATPSLLTGGIWPYAMPKHIFEDIPVAKMAESPEVREHPIGFGPFKVETITPGESVVYTKNEDYWQGEPKLDKVTLSVINPTTVVQALETGKVDTVHSFPVDQYPDNAEMSNVEFLGQIDMAYTYIGFKLGTWDKEKKQVKPDPNMKMADVNLRKAMWHAVDNNAVGEQFYNGLRWNATTLIPPSHPEFHDSENPGLAYDPEKAKEILNEAGYEDVNGDGMRENPEGEELVINFASMSGGDTAEPLANYYIQSWKKVGLNVQLLDGRLQEFNTFYDRVGQNGDDDPKVDIFQGAWTVGNDVNPDGLYGRDAIFNFPRYASEENDKLLEEGISEASFDVEHRKEVYNEWQKLMVEEIPVFPTLYRSELVPVNNRVQNYSIAFNWYGRHEISVTQEEPMKAE